MNEKSNHAMVAFLSPYKADKLLSGRFVKDIRSFNRLECLPHLAVYDVHTPLAVQILVG